MVIKIIVVNCPVNLQIFTIVFQFSYTKWAHRIPILKLNEITFLDTIKYNFIKDG